MTNAYWYLFAVFLLPYVFVVLAKTNTDFDNSSPRDFLDSLEGWRKRSHWVQLNSFEIFPPFASAVIIAHQLNASQTRLDTLALAFLILRVMYGVCYIADKSTLRTIAWLGSLACVIGIFFIAA